MMWHRGWRDQVWSILDTKWDLIVIGGGITGAGILREATRAGLRTLLLEANDFASGTSSRSSKLIHGGFRYLRNGQIGLTLQSVRERERLLKEGRGLIYPLGFLLATYKGDRPPYWVYGLGLSLYDLLAFKWGHRYYDAFDLKELCPYLNDIGLLGGYRYFDALADDARLVIRVIRESVAEGGFAVNYMPVLNLLRDNSGRVCGVAVRDDAPEARSRTREIQADFVVNATGAWADQLCTFQREPGKRHPPQLRKLRGSHLVFSAQRLPLTRSICLMHPMDRRPVFAFPWEGIIIIGTTDVDYDQPMQTDPAISQSEIEYLMVWVNHAFPQMDLTLTDVMSTYAGIRPVIGSGKVDPSKESREHILFCENGLLTVAGGKLTTFRLMAHDALNSIRKQLKGMPKFDPNLRVLNLPPTEEIISAPLSRISRLRILGRYAVDAPEMVNSAQPGELESIDGLPTLWAELRWAARSEGVVHLDDLLLRRLRLGIQLPNGGFSEIKHIRSIVQSELGWDDNRWKQEENNYRKKIKENYQI